MARSIVALIALSILLLIPHSALSGQVDRGLSAAGWTRTVSLGPSVLLNDVGENNYSGFGTIARAGVRFPLVDVTLGTEYWPDTNDFRILSAQVEGAFYLSRAPSTPVLLMGLGHSWSHYFGPYEGRGPNGTAASVGLGMHIQLSHTYALSTEALMRTDDVGWNASFRALFGYAPEPQFDVQDVPAPNVEFYTFWMLPVHGPWHFVQPAYAIGYSRPLNARYAVDLDVALIHWQTPGAGFMRNYIWDTRSFIVMPSAEWRIDNRGFMGLRGGPAVVLMGEGPDNGATVGVDALIALSGRPIGVPLSLGAGWLWFARGNSDPRVGGDDQHGLILSAGLEF